MTYEVHMMVGVPGSGKSTFIKQERENLEESGLTTCVISRDYIRKQILLDDDYYFDREEDVFREFVRQINEAMELSIDVVFIDATHLNSKSRAGLLRKLQPDPKTSLILEVMDTSFKTCLARNSKRKGFERVPTSSMKEMMSRFSRPHEGEFPKDKWGFKDIKINVHKEG
ncbi:MAG: ATP-binding protein [Lachnospiraceae bacterium]|nr:ATP-binding protein [Lachnospiraceae bacterium]